MPDRLKSKKENRFSGTRVCASRRLQIENLEGRTLMTVAPLGAGVPVAALQKAAAVAASPGIPIAANEFHGLTAAESKTLQDLAAMGSPAQQNASTVPSATLKANGILVIQGCRGDDKVEAGNPTGVAGRVRVTHFVNGKLVRTPQDFTGVNGVVFLAYGGNNVFYNNSNLPSKALGGAGIDQFNGGRVVDTFFGLGGDDELNGFGGSDNLYGGTGSDTLRAGKIDGSEFNCVNVLRGGLGNDVLVGGGGINWMYGDDGSDSLTQPTGEGHLFGGAGNDTLWGQDYPRLYLEMHGGSGNDTLIVKPAEASQKLWAADDYNDNAWWLR